LVKVKLKLLPGRTGELKAPWFAVTVWVTLSWFVQVTLVPTVTVRLLGLNEKFIIETLFPLLVAVVGVGVGVGVAVGVAVGAVVGVVPVPVVAGAPPQAARSTSKPTASRHSQACVMVGVDGFFMSLPLLQGFCMNTAEDFLSPPDNTLPGYITYQLRLMTACVQMPPIAEIKNNGNERGQRPDGQHHQGEQRQFCLQSNYPHHQGGLNRHLD